MRANGTVRIEKRVVGKHKVAIAHRLEHQRSDFILIVAQMKDDVIEFARQLQRPERSAGLHHIVSGSRWRGRWACQRKCRDALRAVDCGYDIFILDACIGYLAREGRQFYPLACAGAF